MGGGGKKKKGEMGKASRQVIKEKKSEKKPKSKKKGPARGCRGLLRPPPGTLTLSGFIKCENGDGTRGLFLGAKDA